jgi:hypothetical protein
LQTHEIWLFQHKNKKTNLVFRIYLRFGEILSMADEKEISIQI